MSEQNSIEPLPGPSSSERAPRAARTKTAFGHFLVVSHLVDEAVVLEWELEYTDAIADEIRHGRPLF